MVKKDMKIREVRVVMDSGTDTYFGADARAVAAALENCSAAGVGQTYPIWLDDTMEEVTYNMAHVVKFSAFYRSE